MAAPRTISLYTGAGGLDLGLEAAGFRNLVAVEMEPVAVSTLRHPANRHRWGEILGTDIHALIKLDSAGRRSAAPILDAAGVKEGDVELLAGGPPCQPFSKSGYWKSGDSKRLDDPRAKTLQAYLDVLETALPQAFLLENVPGISFNSKAEGLSFLKDQVEAINRRKGTRYSFSVQKLNAAEYGVPQLRERVFVVGHREGREFLFPPPTHALPPAVDMAGGGRTAVDSYEVGPGLEPARTAWEAIGHLEDDDDRALQMRGKWAPVLATIPEGANYLWHTSRGGGVPLWGWRTRYWSMLLKIAKARPAWTLTAQPGPAIGPFHWKSRRFSADELKGLQTVPPDYVITGSVLDAHFQLGNAVPSALSEMLGRQIRWQLLGDALDTLVPSLLPKRAATIPPPEPPAPASSLPPNILELVGDHADHPGTGRGPSASARDDAAAK